MNDSRRRSAGHRVLERLVRSADRVVPGTASVVVHSAPDLDDNVVALLHARPGGVRVTVLTEDRAAAARRARALGLGDVELARRRSLRGLWRYLRASVVMSTHGVFGSRRRRAGKHSVGLWHGEFGKLVGSFIGEPPHHFDWVPVSSQLARAVRCAEFELHPARVHVVGAPRQALLGAGSTGAGSGAGPRKVVWAPTYRSSVTGWRRVDGDPTVVESVPPDDPALVALLERHGAELWLRPHPLADQTVAGGRRVRAATNAALEERGTTFYGLLADADVLVTDYSSVWVDFLLLDRPVVGFCPDLERYRRDRGLALEPHEEWFPGPVTVTKDEFLAALDGALTGRTVDRWVERRRQVRSILHTADGDPVGATWGHVVTVLGQEPVRP